MVAGVGSSLSELLGSKDGDKTNGVHGTPRQHIGDLPDTPRGPPRVSGVDNLTLCPRTVGEVESVCRGGSWPPTTDAAPWLFRRWSKLDKATGAMEVDASHNITFFAAR